MTQVHQYATGRAAYGPPAQRRNWLRRTAKSAERLQADLEQIDVATLLAAMGSPPPQQRVDPAALEQAERLYLRATSGALDAVEELHDTVARLT